MPFHIKDPATDLAVRRLARLKGATLTETVRQAAEQAYQREATRIPLIERIKPLRDRFAALRRPEGQPADKAYFDELSGDI